MPGFGSMLMVQSATWPVGFRVWHDRVRFGRRRQRHRPAQQNGCCARELTAMATLYQDNASSEVQPAQGAPAAPVVRTITLSDLHRALQLGWEDFKAVP